MPFDYQKFDQQCTTMTTDELLKQHKHYTKLSAGAMTSTAVSALSIPLTLGLSGIAIGMSMPAHSNAKKKKQIVEKYLKARGIESAQNAQYATAVAQDSAQKQQMWMQQQAWQSQQGGSSNGDAKSPPSMDLKYNSFSDSKSEKKSSKGPMPSEDAPPPPPPTYEESASSPTSPGGYAQQPPQWGQPQMGYGMPQQGWGQPQMGYSQPQGYGHRQQGGWGQQQNAYCYPNSAMYSNGQPMNSNAQHVRFTQ